MYTRTVMKTAVLIGTFDPLHGGHIGQALRAHQAQPCDALIVCVDKHPLHKPQASSWQHRLHMANLAVQAVSLPFNCTVLAVEDSRAQKIRADFKISGIDSLIDNLQDPSRLHLAQQWPMIVLSIPGIAPQLLTKAVAALPANVRQTIRYTYYDEAAVPMMNYNFEQNGFVSERVHSTHLRSGRQSSLIPDTTRAYIEANRLYLS